MPDLSPRLTKAKKVAFFVATLVVILLAAEIAVRAIDPPAVRPAYYGYPPDLIVPDSVLGHKYRAGFRGFFPARRYHQIPIAINSQGFRDDEWKPRPDPACPRVMVIGDSITFGAPVFKEQRFAEVAARMLRERGRCIETCNCGVNGFNIDRYETVLTNLGPALAPRIVVIGLCLNDIEPASPDDDYQKQMLEARNEKDERWPLFVDRYRLDLGKSYAVALLRAAWLELRWKSNPSMMNQRYTEDVKKHLERDFARPSAREHLSERLAAMSRFCQTRLDAKLMVLVLPYRHELAERDPHLSLIIDGMLEARRIPHLDLYDVFLPQADAKGLYAYKDDCHPDVLGHSLAGAALANWLENAGFGGL